MTPSVLPDYIQECEKHFGIKVIQKGRFFIEWTVTYKDEIIYQTGDSFNLRIFLHGMFIAHQIKE
jgi:hypothetical protein